MHLTCDSDVINTGASAVEVYLIDCVLLFLTPWPLYLQGGCILCNLKNFLSTCKDLRLVLLNFGALQS